jgi:hypothetical protein
VRPKVPGPQPHRVYRNGARRWRAALCSPGFGKFVKLQATLWWPDAVRLDRTLRMRHERRWDVFGMTSPWGGKQTDEFWCGAELVDTETAAMTEWRDFVDARNSRRRLPLRLDDFGVREESVEKAPADLQAVHRDRSFARAIGSSDFASNGLAT